MSDEPFQSHIVVVVSSAEDLCATTWSTCSCSAWREWAGPEKERGHDPEAGARLSVASS